MKWLSSRLVLLCICSFLLVCAGCGKKAATEAKPVTPPATTSTPATDVGTTEQAAPTDGDPAYLPVEGESSEMPPDATMPKAPKPGVRLPD